MIQNWLTEWWNIINEHWLVKILAAGFLYLGAFIFAGTAQLAGTLIGLMILNTLTKWVVVAIQFRRDRGEPVTGWSIFRGIFAQAWQSGYLDRGEWKNKTFKKIYQYTPLVIALGLAYRIVPQNWITLVYAFLGGIELSGILKNLRASGYEELEQLGDAIEEKKDKLLK